MNGFPVQGHPLRDAREARGWTLRSTAARAGVDPAHLSRIERGEAQPTIDTLYRLAEALELHDLAEQLQPHISPRRRS